jgi:hypothetical protein
VPQGPRNNASSRLVMKAQVARSNQTAIDLGIEVEIELVEGFCGSRKPGEFAPPLQQSVGAARELVVDQACDQIDGCHGLCLRLVESDFQHGWQCRPAVVVEVRRKLNLTNFALSCRLACLIFCGLYSRICG